MSFDGPTEFAELVRLAFDTAASQGWREIIISDKTFEDWPLGEHRVAQSLQDWAKSGRRFTMLAKNYDEVVRRHARFVTWRRTWAHIVECRSNAVISPENMPSAFWSQEWVLQRIDPVRSIGFSGGEPARRVALKEKLDECLRHSAHSFAATTLGL